MRSKVMKSFFGKFAFAFAFCALAENCVPALGFGFTPRTVFAEEAAEEGDSAEGGETAEEGMAEGETGAIASGAVTPSQIETNIQGKYLALSFPDSEVPMGFTTRTVEYEGATVELAELETKSATIGVPGLTVTIAYLTDADGSNGEFYLCDTTENARMSDMIKIDGADGRYLIILDPGDNVVGPVGFTKRTLQWGGKTATAWSLPTGNASKSQDSSEKDEEGGSEDEDSSESALDSLFFTKVYAAGIPSAGSGSVGNSSGDSSTDSMDGSDLSNLPEEVKESAMQELDSIAHTNASGLIQAHPKEFCLLYATDESGNLGFYLYDITGRTYQRYVEIDKGESDTLTKYRKLSRTRLLIIVILIIALVIMTFLFINSRLSGGRRTYKDVEDDDEEDDMEAMRRRVAKKERSGIRTSRKNLNAFLDVKDGEEEEEAQPKVMRDRAPSTRSTVVRPAVTANKPAQDRGPAAVPQERAAVRQSVRQAEPQRLPSRNPVPVERNKAEDSVDWANMEITAGLPKGVEGRGTGRQAPASQGMRTQAAPSGKTAASRQAPEQAAVRNTVQKRNGNETRKPGSARKDNFDFDDDFDFEFLDV